MSKKKNRKNNKKKNKNLVDKTKEELNELTSNDIQEDQVEEVPELKTNEPVNEVENLTNSETPDEDAVESDFEETINEEDIDDHEEEELVAAAAGGGGAEPPKNSKGGLKGFWQDRSPVLRFVILFALFMAIFYSIWATQWFHDEIVSRITTFDAKIASLFLNIFGYETLAEGTSIASKRVTVNVKTGCDGIEAMALFVSGVTAYTAPLSHKVKGIIAGVSFLFFMNLVRIVHLWLSGYYMPEYFEFFHENFWQIVFIFLSIITWAMWINRINKKSKKAANA